MPTASRVAATGRVCALAAALVVAGCTNKADTNNNDAPSRNGTPTTAAAVVLPDPQPTPRPRLSDAVRDLLAAEQRMDRAASFLLVSRQSRVEYKDVADWTRRRQQLPAVTGFRIDPGSEGGAADKTGKVVVVLEHEPGLDPFRGLSPARETATFAGHREGAGWLVDGDANTEPILPPEPKAIDATVAWVSAVQACDQARAGGLQAVATLYGSATGAVGLCGKAGPVAAADVARLSASVASTDIVAQYTTDALVWARVVRVSAPAAFGVVLAPLGDSWKVLGLTD